MIQHSFQPVVLAEWVSARLSRWPRGCFLSDTSDTPGVHALCTLDASTQTCLEAQGTAVLASRQSAWLVPT